MLIEIENEKSSTVTKDPPKTRHFRRPIAAVSAVIVLGAAVAAIFEFKSRFSAPNGVTWQMISWRLDLFARKAKGDVPELSWRELWFMTHARGGFGLEGFVRQGFSLEGSIANPYVTSDDHQSGARIFRDRCAMCHGNEGSGGEAPRLNRSGLSHGDSELAKYMVTRDGIPHTGMAPVPMSVKERWQLVGYLTTLQVSAASRSAEHAAPIDIQVTGEQIRNAASAPDQWLTYSGSLNGWRYTSLAEITPENVSRLRLRWIHQFDAPKEKNESTPIVAGGVIFETLPPADVVAIDIRSGRTIWQYTRSLPDKLPACCGQVNRGLAILGNVLFYGSLDDVLVAIDARNGSVVWQTRVANPSDGFTMTGAPLIANGSVVVGVAGGEYGIRGFLAAYDAKTGQLRWKFNTIPGPGEFGHDTWKNDAWRTGGGATWVTGSYDPALDLVYWGVGNPAPGIRGEGRPGDNLFTCSLIALHGSSGKLAWYFQFTPHDEHDYDAAETPILADIRIKGVLRHVICVATKNGFYYVLDRTNGGFLVGVPFVEENWAKGLDATGRPILSSGAEPSVSGRSTRPGAGGGTNWENAAFDPRSGLIFIAATEGTGVFTKSPNDRRGDLGFYAGSAGPWTGPPDPVVRVLDAATGARKWEYSSPKWKASFAGGYGGLLATRGNLVFGTSGGFVFAIDSATGREVWRVFLGGDTYAAPVSVRVDGRQVILISAGRAMFMFGL
ncbi:MAG TPA: PQQ-binding-like beta-propeller repeat protein [Terriglobia bacterium]|nr:PQQ-binding-like beta-propeller repeat protein [Terriglobia bacterium]